MGRKADTSELLNGLLKVITKVHEGEMTYSPTQGHVISDINTILDHFLNLNLAQHSSVTKDSLQKLTEEA